MSNIAIVDADFIGGGNNRFPNLACMKMSAYHKQKQIEVTLLEEQVDLSKYDTIYVSKVFSKSIMPQWLEFRSNVICGGTGFFYDKSPQLPAEVEHCMPDYGLYDSLNVDNEYFHDYSIGFATRHCFRRCEFCVNKNYTKVERNSPIVEFFDERRKHICLLDDNILGYSEWRVVFDELKDTGRYFQFKQGMDIRLMTESKAYIISTAKYRGDFIFAFDNIQERSIVEEKLTLWRKYNDRNTKLYVLCAYDRSGKYDESFWINDIEDTLERITILMEHSCMPYLMRYDKYEDSPFAGLYIELARWCNQPSHFKKMSFEEFCLVDMTRKQTPKRFKEFATTHSEIASKYFHRKYKPI
jgi:hypothetical protein